MPRVELLDYRKARTPFGSLMRLFRYFKHCRLILVCAVVSILVYAAATIAASYCMKPLVNLLKESGLAPDEVYAKYFSGDCPARCAMQVSALPKGALVEIEAIAVKP